MVRRIRVVLLPIAVIMKAGGISLYKVSIFVVTLLAIVLGKDRAWPKMTDRPRRMISKVCKYNRPVFANIDGIFQVNIVIAQFLPRGPSSSPSGSEE
jgi:hypothetical protein